MSNWSKIGKTIRKTARWSVRIMIAVLAFIVIALNLPFVQQKLVDSLTTYLSDKSNHELSISSAKINWLDRFTLNGVSLKDSEDSLMISVNRVNVNFSLVGLLEDGSLNLDGIELDSVKLNLRKYANDEGLNITTFLESLRSGDSSSTAVHNDYLEVSHLDFSYQDHSDTASARIIVLDVNDLKAGRLNLYPGEVYLSSISSGTIGTSFGIDLEEIQADLIFTQSFIELDNFNLITGGSNLGEYVRLEYESPSDLREIYDKVNFKVRLSDSKIRTRDIQPFINADISKIDSLVINSEINGTLDRLKVSKTLLVFGDYTRFKVDASFNGLPDVNTTFMNLKFDQSIISERYIRKFAPELPRIGSVGFRGNLIGFVNDFVANGTFSTGFGTINSDINLKVGSTPESTQLSGNLGLLNFDLGGLINNPRIGRLGFRGNISGRGLTQNSANFNLSARVTNADIYGHVYKEANLNGTFKSKFFDGEIDIKDPSVIVKGAAKIDFGSDTEVVDVDLGVDSLDLAEFGINENPILLSFEIDSDLRELNFNETAGRIDISNLTVNSDGEISRLQDFRILAETEGERKYSLSSDNYEIELNGDFVLSDLIEDIPRTAKEFFDFFTTDRTELEAYYSSMGPEEEPSIGYDANLEAKIKNVDDILSLFEIPLSMSSDLYVESKFKQRKDASFSIYMEADSLKYEDRFLRGNVLEINASKDIDSLGVLALIQISSKEQQWDIFSNTQDFYSESVWANNQLRLNFQLSSPQTNSRANISSLVQLLRDTINMELNSSRLTAFGNQWEISDDNRIQFTNGNTEFENLEFSTASQSIKISGNIADSSTSNMGVSFVDFDLKTLSTIIPRKFEGVLNGSANLERTLKGQPFQFVSESRVDDLVFEDVFVGSLEGEANNSSDGINLDYQLIREGINTISVTGNLNNKAEDQLDIDVVFQQANLNVLEPFLGESVSGLSGFASGDIKILGAIDDPKITGLTEIQNGSVTVNYLNTTYGFSGNASFDQNLIKLERMQIRDRLGNTGTIGGEIRHRALKNISLDLRFPHTNFELLNTTRSNNSLYYGNAYSTGTIRFSGPLENILIQADARTQPNTRIYIPFTEETTVESGSFISFTSSSSNTNNPEEEDEEGVQIRGITLDFDVEVTPDAYVELIFNPRTGDIIRGRGDGNIQLNIDPNGQFEMFGSIEIREGAYNFTTRLINKEFQLKPGGTISWYGDMAEGILDLEAYYRQLASYEDWRPDPNAEGSSSLKQPVLVNLNLQGPMLNPDISFGIEMEDQNIVNSNDNWRSLISTVNNNDEELKRQVFSLLMLRKFSEENSFAVGIRQGIGGSVSEFVSNQLSYWINQVDENLEVSIDLNSFDNDAFNTFQLRLAYTFLDGRLRVTRGGGVTTVVQTDENSFSGVIGDWSVEYLLTEDGRFRVKAFSRNNQSTIGQTVNEQQTGASFEYIRSFDQFKELLNLSRKEASNSSGDQNKRSTDSAGSN